MLGFRFKGGVLYHLAAVTSINRHTLFYCGVGNDIFLFIFNMAE